MRTTLRGRLLAACAAVVLAAVGAVGYLASRATHYEFRRVETFHVIENGGPPRVERRILENGSRRAPDPPSGSSVDRWIVAAVLGVGLASLAAVALLTRRILAPIGELTRAARRLESGDLNARVPDGGSDEVGELARAFNRMASALLRNEETRRNMVSDVAHELRTPLTNLRARIEAVQDGLSSPDAAVVASLHEDTMLLSRLVEDLQDLALADAGELRMNFSPVEIRDSLERAASAYRARAAARNIRLVVAPPPGLPRVRADANRLGQVLRNLLENALAHTPDGGEISVSASGEASGVRITVGDTGAGIAPEDVARVFERFYRADPARSRGTGGSGLGLPIVRQLVRAHGGEVSIESAPGRGTAVTFSLPFIENS